MTATTVPPMIPAMAAVCVQVHLFLVPPRQLVRPTTRLMAQGVYPLTLHPAWFVTMVTTAQKMMRAMAAGRVQVCLMFAQALQLAHQSTFKMVQDVFPSMQWLEAPATMAIPPQAMICAMVWECVREVSSV